MVHAATKTTLVLLRLVQQGGIGGCPGGAWQNLKTKFPTNKARMFHRGPSMCYTLRVPSILMKLYRFSNDILVHSISTGCPTLTRSRWAPSCHTWRGTNLTWQKWVGISILLIKTGRAGKTFLQGQSIKEKAWGLFHSCFAHWPESSGAAGNGVIGSAKVLPAEGHFTAFRVFKKYTSRTPHAHCFFCLFLTSDGKTATCKFISNK